MALWGEERNMEKCVAMSGPIKPGTFVRMFPERHPDGRYIQDTAWTGRSVYFEGHPVFEVTSFILDGSGTYVTFCRQPGTFYLFGAGDIEDRKFPFPHAMFEVLDDVEAEQIRLSRRREIAARQVQRKRWAWPSWLWPRAMRQAHT